MDQLNARLQNLEQNQQQQGAQMANIQQNSNAFNMIGLSSSPNPILPYFRGETWDSNFGDWHQSFTVVADACSWDEAKRLRILPAYIFGPAREYLYSLAPAVKADYNQLVQALTNRYRPPQNSQFRADELMDRKQKDNESVEQYAATVQKLIREAYTDFPAETRATLARTIFLRGLQKHLKFSVEDRDPATFDDAVIYAKRYECRTKAMTSSTGINSVTLNPYEPASSTTSGASGSYTVNSAQSTGPVPSQPYVNLPLTDLLATVNAVYQQDPEPYSNQFQPFHNSLNGNFDQYSQHNFYKGHRPYGHSPNVYRPPQNGLAPNRFSNANYNRNRPTFSHFIGASSQRSQPFVFGASGSNYSHRQSRDNSNFSLDDLRSVVSEIMSREKERDRSRDQHPQSSFNRGTYRGRGHFFRGRGVNRHVAQHVNLESTEEGSSLQYDDTPNTAYGVTIYSTTDLSEQKPEFFAPDQLPVSEDAKTRDVPFAYLAFVSDAQCEHDESTICKVTLEHKNSVLHNCLRPGSVGFQTLNKSFCRLCKLYFCPICAHKANQCTDCSPGLPVKEACNPHFGRDVRDKERSPNRRSDKRAPRDRERNRRSPSPARARRSSPPHKRRAQSVTLEPHPKKQKETQKDSQPHPEQSSSSHSVPQSPAQLHREASQSVFSLQTVRMHPAPPASMAAPHTSSQAPHAEDLILGMAQFAASQKAVTPTTATSTCACSYAFCVTKSIQADIVRLEPKLKAVEGKQTAERNRLACIGGTQRQLVEDVNQLKTDIENLPSQQQQGETSLPIVQESGNETENQEGIQNATEPTGNSSRSTSPALSFRSSSTLGLATISMICLFLITGADAISPQASSGSDGSTWRQVAQLLVPLLFGTFLGLYLNKFHYKSVKDTPTDKQAKESTNDQNDSDDSVHRARKDVKNVQAVAPVRSVGTSISPAAAEFVPGARAHPVAKQPNSTSKHNAHTTYVHWCVLDQPQMATSVSVVPYPPPNMSVPPPLIRGRGRSVRAHAHNGGQTCLRGCGRGMTLDGQPTAQRFNLLPAQSAVRAAVTYNQRNLRPLSTYLLVGLIMCLFPTAEGHTTVASSETHKGQSTYVEDVQKFMLRFYNVFGYGPIFLLVLRITLIIRPAFVPDLAFAVPIITGVQIWLLSTLGGSLLQLSALFNGSVKVVCGLKNKRVYIILLPLLLNATPINGQSKRQFHICGHARGGHPIEIPPIDCTPPEETAVMKPEVTLWTCRTEPVLKDATKCNMLTCTTVCANKDTRTTNYKSVPSDSTVVSEFQLHEIKDSIVSDEPITLLPDLKQKGTEQKTGQSNKMDRHATDRVTNDTPSTTHGYKLRSLARPMAAAIFAPFVNPWSHRSTFVILTVALLFFPEIVFASTDIGTSTLSTEKGHFVSDFVLISGFLLICLYITFLARKLRQVLLFTRKLGDQLSSLQEQFTTHLEHETTWHEYQREINGYLRERFQLFDLKFERRCNILEGQTVQHLLEHRVQRLEQQIQLQVQHENNREVQRTLQHVSTDSSSTCSSHESTSSKSPSPIALSKDCPESYFLSSDNPRFMRTFSCPTLGLRTVGPNVFHAHSLSCLNAVTSAVTCNRKLKVPHCFMMSAASGSPAGVTVHENGDQATASDSTTTKLKELHSAVERLVFLVGAVDTRIGDTQFRAQRDRMASNARWNDQIDENADFDRRIRNLAADTLERLNNIQVQIHNLSALVLANQPTVPSAASARIRRVASWPLLLSILAIILLLPMGKAFSMQNVTSNDGFLLPSTMSTLVFSNQLRHKWSCDAKMLSTLPNDKLFAFDMCHSSTVCYRQHSSFPALIVSNKMAIVLFPVNHIVRHSFDKVPDTAEYQDLQAVNIYRPLARHFEMHLLHQHEMRPRRSTRSATYQIGLHRQPQWNDTEQDMTIELPDVQAIKQTLIMLSSETGQGTTIGLMEGKAGPHQDKKKSD